MADTPVGLSGPNAARTVAVGRESGRGLAPILLLLEMGLVAQGMLKKARNATSFSALIVSSLLEIPHLFVLGWMPNY